jgi:site-specific DNA recombinase
MYCCHLPNSSARLSASGCATRSQLLRQIWVGGSIPLGYASINKKLVVVAEEADTVLLIFRRYLEFKSIRDLAEDLDRQGIRTRRQTLSTGQIRGGIRFGVGALAHLLRNRFYIGEALYRRAVHPGEHEAIRNQRADNNDDPE